MKDDTINRADAIKEIKKCGMTIDGGYDSTDVICALEELPSAGKWIPCSERLPEDNERVLVTTAWGYVTIGWISKGIWSTELIVNCQDFVLAWMPLPKPWKGADDEA